MATKKTFLYFEVEVSQSLRDTYNEYDHCGFVLARTLEKMIEDTNSKNAKTVKEILTACMAQFSYKDDTNIGAICMEFITKRDYDRRKSIYGEVADYFSDAGITISNEVVRHMDINGMQVTGPQDDSNSYWKTKVYFNETLPASRGFDTTCLQEEADGEMSWIEHWTRPL